MQRYEIYFKLPNNKPTFLLNYAFKHIFQYKYKKKHYLCRKFTKYVPVYTRHYHNGKELQPTRTWRFICAPDRIRHPTCRRISRTLPERQPTQADRQHNRQRRSTAHRRQPRYKSAYIQTEKPCQDQHTRHPPGGKRGNQPTGRDRRREEKGEELRTRDGLINALTKEIQLVHGKDSVQGLVSLAKLQGFDKEDTRQEDERRYFVLPSVGKCRSCQLMKILQELVKESTEK